MEIGFLHICMFFATVFLNFILRITLPGREASVRYCQKYLLDGEALPHPFPEILRRNSFHLGFRVSIGKRLGDAAFLFRIPLEFERLNF